MSALSNLAGRSICSWNHKISYCCCEFYRSSSTSSYKETVFLPKTDFPHRVNSTKRVERDRDIEKKARFDELYNWQLKHKKGKRFVLHDGPPYANGDVHIGHAVNKILKDITIRSKLLNDAQISFIPGWDCHGLPIELKVVRDIEALSTNTGKAEVCRKAYEFAENARKIQLASFKKWGLLADWKNIYQTCRKEYIIAQLQLFYSLYEKDLVYQDYKPVFWSPSNRTSLAEAELEYNLEHVSPSIYVKFPIVKCPDAFTSTFSPGSKLSAVIWTTTPWTLPANQAICYAENKRYCILQSSDKKDLFIICCELVNKFKDIQGNLPVLMEFDGHLLSECTYHNPLKRDDELPFLHGDHVTMDKGTGLVHMAPNHGLEDYVASKKWNIPLSPCLVNDAGCFTSEAGDTLSGKYVLGSGTEEILQLMKGYILHQHDYKHSYPYDWRSNKPVIIRSSLQWFIDVQALKEKANNCLNDVEVIPASLKQQFLMQLEKSPQWCISRQRAWGVPIPVFYHADSKSPVINKPIIDHLCKLIQEKGIHFWWELTENQMLSKQLIEQSGLSNAEFIKGKDIFDIWFDSGISWNILPEPKVADVCLEGVDQIRGWFHSSLLTSIATRNVAPYKKLFLHGFTTDADGKKMSKSKGNVISPSDITDGLKRENLPALGIDVLRWWVSGHACQHDNIPVKTNILEECQQNISKVRNVLKFLLGSLHQFDFEKDGVELSQMKPLDQYILHLSKTFLEKVQSDYNEMQYKNVIREVVNFFTNEVSAFYCQLIKDRLYCDSKSSLSRRSCQTAIHLLFDVLVHTIAPVTPHLAEEVYSFHPNESKVSTGVFRADWTKMWDILSKVNSPVAVLWALHLRNFILKSEKKLSDSELSIFGSERLLKNLQVLQEDQASSVSGLCEIFQVSRVIYASSGSESNIERNQETMHGIISASLTGDTEEEYTVVVKASPREICPRCRRRTSESKLSLCLRCSEVIKELGAS